MGLVQTAYRYLTIKLLLFRFESLLNSFFGVLFWMSMVKKVRMLVLRVFGRLTFFSQQFFYIYDFGDVRLIFKISVFDILTELHVILFVVFNQIPHSRLFFYFHLGFLVFVVSVRFYQIQIPLIEFLGPVEFLFKQF